MVAHLSSVPKVAVFRLSLYLRELSQLAEKGEKTVSSSKLATRLGFTDAQVRKDLAYFGQFGYPGVGYHVDELIAELKKILGTNRTWDVLLIGCGNLGRALATYRGFEPQGFRIAGAFDNDPAKVGQRIGKLTIQPMAQLAEAVSQAGAHLAVLCVPNDQAQTVADQAVAAGIRGFLNFASTSISTPPNVVQNSVDLALRLEQLSFGMRAMEEDQAEGQQA